MVGEKRSILRNSKSAYTTVPARWLAFLEEKEGKKVVAFEMEATDCLIFKPIFEK